MNSPDIFSCTLVAEAREKNQQVPHIGRRIRDNQICCLGFDTVSEYYDTCKSCKNYIFNNGGNDE